MILAKAEERLRIARLLLAQLALAPYAYLRLLHPPYADDLHLIAVAYEGIARDGRLGFVTRLVTESSSGSHVLPLGGLVTGLYAVVAEGLAQVFGLSIRTTWALLQIASVSLLLYSLSRLLSWGSRAEDRRDRSWTILGVNLLFLAAFQIRSTTSNDPLAAFPVAGVLTGALTMVTISWLLSFFSERTGGSKLTSTVQPLRLLLAYFVGLSTGFLYEVAILYYGLTFILVALRLLAEYSSLEKRERERSECLGVLWGLTSGAFGAVSAIGIGLLIRALSGTNASYSGTQLSPMSLGQMLLSAVIGGLSVLPVSPKVWTWVRNQPSQAGPVLAGWLLLMVSVYVSMHVSRETRRLVNGERRHEQRGLAKLTHSTKAVLPLTVLTLAFGTWLVSALSRGLFLLTPKYQTEIGRSVTRVYMDYIPALTTLLMASFVVGVEIKNWLVLARSKLRIVLIGVLLVPISFVTVESKVSSNQSVQSLRRDWSWSANLVDSFSDLSKDEESLCRAYSYVYSLSLPSYYEEIVAESFRTGFEMRSGMSICNKGAQLIPIQGFYPIESDGNQNWVWTSAGISELRLKFGRDDLSTREEGIYLLRIGASPCGALEDVEISARYDDGQSRVLYNGALAEPTVVEVPVLNSTGSLTLKIETPGNPCSVSGDVRSFGLQIFLE